VVLDHRLEECDAPPAGVGTVISFVGIASSFENSFLDLYRTARMDIIVTRGGFSKSFTSTLPERLVEPISKIDGVTGVFPGLMEGAAIEATGNQLVMLQGWPPGAQIFDTITIVTGRRLELGDKQAIVIGVDLAAQLGKSVGDKLKIFDNEVYEIVGTMSGYRWDNNGIVMPLPELQRLMGRPNQVTGISVRVARPDDVELIKRVCQEINALESGVQAKPYNEHVGSRAIGWSKRRVIRMILLESVILSLIAAGVGTIGAMVLLQLANRVPPVKGFLETEVQPMLVLEAFIIAGVVGFVCASLPARRAANMQPTTALRHE